jgi:hypothetical protein
MTTNLNTSCSENIMVLSARRGFLYACIFSIELIREMSKNYNLCTTIENAEEGVTEIRQTLY